MYLGARSCDQAYFPQVFSTPSVWPVVHHHIFNLLQQDSSLEVVVNVVRQTAADEHEGVLCLRVRQSTVGKCLDPSVVEKLVWNPHDLLVTAIIGAEGHHVIYSHITAFLIQRLQPLQEGVL